MSRNRRAALAALMAMLFLGCSARHTMGRDQLNSAATEVISLAAEGELFTFFVATGHSTAAYAEGHPEYLQERARGSLKRLQKAKAEPDLQDQLQLLLSAALQVSRDLDQLPSAAGDPHRLQEFKDHFAATRHTAEEIRRAP